MKKLKYVLLVIGTLCCQIRAQNFILNDGDLVIGFQATSGTGNTKNVFFNVGSATDIRDGKSLGKIGNINETLRTCYGNDWYTRANLFFGAFANFSQGSAVDTEYPDYAEPVNGDPNSTCYISTPASSAGQGTLYAEDSFGNSDLTNGANSFSNVESMCPQLTIQADNSAVLDASEYQLWEISWTKFNPFVQGNQGAAFDSFPGGIQQNFGKGGGATYVDIQRVVATNLGASPQGVVGGGQYVVTIAIGSNGDITLSKAVSSIPIISITGAPGTLNTTAGTASTTSSFSVSGTDMTAGIAVTAPTGFEVSTSSNASFSSNITIGTSGTIASTPVYVRIPANASSGNYTGNITLSSTGAESKNISVSGTVIVPTPLISVSGNLTALSTTYGTASSTSNFTISGTNMTAPITVTPPTGFQVSTSSNSSFATSISVPASGTLANTTIHVRLSPTANAGTYSGNITLTSTGATEKTIATSSSTISKATQTIDAIASVGNKAFGDAAFSVTTPSSSSSLPVTLSVKSGPATISGNTVTITGAGTVVLAANQAGNDNYNAATEVTTNFTVSKGAQTIGAFTSISTKAFGDAPFAVTAPSASSSLPVTLSVKSGPATISGNSVTLTGVGTVTLAANQAGNANYNAATEVTTSFSVSNATQTIATFASIGTKTFGDAPFAVTAPTASSGLAVTLSVKSGPATISGTTVTITGAGTVTLAANQAGNADYAAATEVTTSFSVAKAAQTIGAFTSIGNKTFGDAPFAVTAPSSSSSLLVTLSVKSGPATISGNSVTLTGVGTVTLAANQAGNADYAAATEVTASFSVSKAAQTIAAFASISNKTFGDASFAVTAPSSSSSLPVTLSVKSGPATILGNTVTLTGAGTLTLAANQAGNANYNAATEVTTNFTISNATQTIGTFASIGNKTFGDAPFAVTAPTASSGLAVALSVKSGPATISGSTVTITGAGTVVIAANQAGNDNYNAAAEVTTSVSVSKATQTIGAFTSIGNKTYGDAPFAVTAPTASSSLPVSLSVKSGPAIISGSTVTITGAGTVTLAANQAGNADYATATEEIASFSVSKAAQTIGSFTSIGTKAFGDAPFTVTAPSSSSSLPVTLSVKSGPATISGNSVTLTGAGTVVIAANQVGDDNFNAATEVTTTFSVSKATPTLANSPTASPIKKGQNLSQSNLTGGSASAAGASVVGSFAFTNPSTAPEAGTANHSVTFTPQNPNNYNTFTFDVSVTVNESNLSALTSPNTTSGDCFQPFQYQITATNNPIGFAANNLPEGIAINAVTGLISGTPTKAGTFNVAITITNTAGDFGSMLEITINKAAQSIDPITTIDNKVFGDVPFAVTAPASTSSLPVTLSVKSGPATILSNTMTLTGVGTVTLAANQAGNDNYNVATEVTTSFTVSKSAQTIGAFTSIGNKTIADVPFAVTAPTSTSSLPVTLSVKSGPASISGNTVTITGAGTIVLAANQAGNSDYAAATEVTSSFSVSKAAQTIGAFTGIGTKAFGDAPFVVTAPSSTSSLSVTLSVKSGPATISGNTVTLTGVGTVTLAANQAGNANYNAASEVTTNFSVSKAAQTIGTFASIGNKTFGDAPFAVTAPTASSALAVTLSVKSGPASISGNTVTITGAGTIVLAANQAGNADYAAATEVTTSFSVSKGAQTIRYFTSIGNKTFGDAPFAITAPTSSSSLPVTLSVKSGPATISGSTVTITGVGTVTLAANQAGNANYNAATEVTTNFTISNATQTIGTFASIGNKTFGDAPFAVTAPTASSGLAVALSVKSGPATISGSTVTITGVGTVTLAANQAGNANYNAATEVTTNFTVSNATQTIGTFASIGNKAFGDAPFAVTAPSSSSSLPVTLSVKSGPATISGNTVTITGAGTVVLAANQAGNADYAAATEVTTSFSVSKAAQTIDAITSIGNKAFGDAPFAVTAPASTSSLPVTLSVKSGPATISGNSVTITGTGAVVLAANQAGNDNYAAATEVTINFLVLKGTSTVTLGSLSPTYDGTAKSATATTSPTITGTVTYTYTGISPTVYDQSSTPPTQAGSYTVVGTINDANYSGNSTGTLVIAKATPSITTKPNASNIALGQKLSDSTLSDGIASVNGSFEFTNPNTQPTTIGTSTPSVTFTPVDTNNYLTATTSIDVVTLAGSNPVITNEPIDLTVSQGNSATFSVQATGQNLIYQWKRNGADISNARSSSYTVSSTSIATAGEYSVVVSSDNGSQPVTSRAAKLIVTFPLADLTLNENTSPVLSVSVTGTGLKYQWFKDGMPLRGQTNSTLTLKDITVDQAGTYSVEVTDADGNKFTSQSSNVTVNAVLPEITSQPSNVSVYTAGNATMRVMVKGAGHSYQWKKNGEPIPGETRNTLSLSDIILADAGEYSVSVKNSVGTITSRSARLTVLTSNSNNQGGATTRPTITTHPAAQTIADGGNATLSVIATGGSLSYQWRRNGTPISGANQASFAINQASINNTGDYSVIVSNSIGSITSNVAKITVNAPEIEVQQPASSILISGTSKISFGTARVGKAGISRTFTIKNIGNLNLSGLTITKAGAHSKDYTITKLSRRILKPGAAITFRVTFKAKAMGLREASIRIASNDRDENPFIINLAGEGAR